VNSSSKDVSSSSSLRSPFSEIKISKLLLLP
jgi:hypothetical protein